MVYLELVEVLKLHRLVLDQHGGAAGIRDLGALESAVAQPRMTFAGADLYPTIEQKAATLCFSLVYNHPSVEGNKRIGFAAMATMLDLNGYELSAPVDDAERTILAIAAGQLPREELTDWVRQHIRERKSR